MDKRRTDFLKIIIVGIPLAFIAWAVLLVLAAYLTHDPYISMYSSIALTIAIVIVYIYLSIKHAPKIGATIEDSEADFKTSEGLFKCGDCGCESTVEEAFRKIKKSGLSGNTKMLCPECWSKEYIAMSKVSFTLSGIAFAGGLIIDYIDPGNVLAAILINFVLIYIFMLTTIIPHELGHAIAGKVMGYRVFRVIIGYGQVLFTRRFLGCEWEFRPFPIGGVTLIATRSTRSYRLRRFVMLLAGPAVNVLFILLLFGILPADGSLVSYSFHGMAPALDFFLANVVLLVFNLWPHKITSSLGVTENDGLALISIPLSKLKQIEDQLAAFYFYSSQELSRQMQYVQSVRVCEEGLGLYPEAMLLRMQLGIVYLRMNEYEKARVIFTELLQHEEIKPGQKMIILNNIAYTNILSGRADLAEEANRYSEEAYKNLPWVPAVKGTRGAVLVETGHVDEGLALLREAYEAYSEPEAKALNAAHIALGEKLRGNTEESMRYLRVVQTLDPQCQLLNRVIAEL